MSNMRKKAPNLRKKQTYLLNFSALQFFSSEAIFILEIFLNVILFIFKTHPTIFKTYKKGQRKVQHIAIYPTLSSKNETLKTVKSIFSITSFPPNIMNLVSTTLHSSIYLYNIHLHP